ncbi:hypothetical protein BVG19_g3808 [[Candida] boidinii]|nr:hypothetical protein BVG19_g3808 [[Candida] boidinii]OWB50527.1 hypothetical protein B5S27_g2077 [[Candida] boidinii]OWB69813.1 hypothetical protein B5S30_g5247 [[Candida] boidinii]
MSNSTITIHNDTKKPMAFKVKTTAPKVYCVRPNASTIPPASSLDVSIIFQGLSTPPSLGDKCKDKLKIVSLPCDASLEAKDVSGKWSELEAAAGGATTDIKLKVSYVFDNEPIIEESTTPSAQQKDTQIKKKPANNNTLGDSTRIAIDDSYKVNKISKENAEDIDKIIDNSKLKSSNVNDDSGVTSALKEKADELKQIKKDPKDITEKKSTTTTSPASVQQTQGTNIYIIAIIFVLLAYFLSRFLF